MPAENLIGSKVEDRLSEILAENLQKITGRWTPEPERRSWERSLPVLARDLVDAGLGKVEMLIEYQLPLTSRRADVVLAGVDARTGEDAYVVVELKQWSHAELYEEDEHLVLVEGYRGEHGHPLLQVQGYCDYITDFVGYVSERPEAVRGVAYLHNAADLDVQDLFQLASTERTRLFTKTRRGAFLEYLRSQFAPAAGAKAADRLLDSATRPSKQLLKLAAAEIKDREQFTLLAEQRVAYDLVQHAVRNAEHSDSKEVVIVTGGPGSGKSVIALSLLGDLSRRGVSVLHATGSRSFTQTMRRHVGKGSSRVKNMFMYFNSFMQAEKNRLDVLICDEAHRIRETSANRFTRAAQRTGRPQVDELIAAARVPVFLLDEHQVVKPNEIGTVEAIESHAAKLGLKVRHVPLDGQFRCGGSRKYEAWVLRLLDLEPGGPEPWTGDDHFEVRLAESPWELEDTLQNKLKDGYSARISAGYCWPWSDPQDGRLVDDVRIGDWARPWNVKGERAVGDAPASALWATFDGGFEQVGCVYTAQGFEYDWSGVILGPDIVARDGRLVTVRQANKDPDFKRRTITDAQYARHIRNIYKVLLTRGMVGTVVYAVDPGTQEFLAELLGETRS
ncbi:DNA/RNA helicase domain-containing protein [Actinoallomurus sp. CA-142502]|uniref:DNA/RNA helicase domain-containing protein n=1 Tax=Actinoallomurus sp. CA-142502 TaxID=3239885 RepID=UPI003D8DCC18